MKNKLFAATGEAGIFIINLDECKVENNVKFNNEYITQLIPVNDILLVKNPGSKISYMLNLKKYFPNHTFQKIKQQENKENKTPICWNVAVKLVTAL